MLFSFLRCKFGILTETDLLKWLSVPAHKSIAFGIVLFFLLISTTWTKELNNLMANLFSWKQWQFLPATEFRMHSNPCQSCTRNGKWKILLIVDNVLKADTRANLHFTIDHIVFPDLINLWNGLSYRLLQEKLILVQ